MKEDEFPPPEPTDVLEDPTHIPVPHDHDHDHPPTMAFALDYPPEDQLYEWPELDHLDPTIHPEMLSEQRILRLECLVWKLMDVIDELRPETKFERNLDDECYKNIMDFTPPWYQTRAKQTQAQRDFIRDLKELDAARGLPKDPRKGKRNANKS